MDLIERLTDTLTDNWIKVIRKLNIQNIQLKRSKCKNVALIPKMLVRSFNFLSRWKINCQSIIQRYALKISCPGTAARLPNGTVRKFRSENDMMDGVEKQGLIKCSVYRIAQCWCFRHIFKLPKLCVECP